jgi:hypothetical protein
MNPEPLYLIVCALGCALLAIVLLTIYVGRLHHRVNKVSGFIDQLAAAEAARQQAWQNQMRARVPATFGSTKAAVR